MIADRWRQVSRLYYAALDRSVEERPGFLIEACRGDEALRQQVESLLLQESHADPVVGDLIGGSADAAIANLGADADAPARFNTIGPYEVISLVGSGGMGEVYRGRDARLGRDVALKVLPERLALDGQHLSRFRREARLLASLNHPNIAAVYGIEDARGQQALVMELVEGVTLTDRIAPGPLPCAEALTIARQIVEGLEAAHKRGIVHRDLKPANVVVRSDGTVKILDFGLAKAFEADASATPADTLVTFAEREGTILGTPAYMSPEQARGLPVDSRADNWAFGCVLYEMLTGRRAFAGDRTAEVVARVLEREPAFDALPADTPQSILRLLQRCLQKNADDRLRQIADARFDIQEALSGLGAIDAASRHGAAESTADTKSAVWRRWRWALTSVVSEVASSRDRVVALPMAGLAAVILALLAAGAAWMLKPQPATSSDEQIARLSIALPDGDRISSSDWPSLDISADGKYVAYVARHEGVPTLMLRAREGVTSQALPGTDGALSPFFSPNGKSIGFFARRRLRTIAIESSETKDLADAPNPRGGWWAEDGFIYYAPGNGAGISKVHSNGGMPSAVTTLDRSKGEISHRWPQVLPGGRALLMSAWTGPARDNRFVQVVRFDNGQRETVATGDSGRYSPSGHVLFSRLDALMAVPFDLDRLAPTGQAFKTVDTARIGSEGASFAVSNRGDLVNLPGDPHRMDTRIVWVDRNGRTEPVPVPIQDIANTILSPDGRRAAFNVHGSTSEIAIIEFERGVVTMLTTNTNGSQAPVWSPNGQRIAYRGTRKGFRNVWVKSVDGTNEEQQLTHGEGMHTPTSWSPNGNNLLFYDATTTSTGWGLSVVSVADGKAQPLGQNGSAAVWSPDGRWIAFASDESGRVEVYVVPFPLTGQRWHISTEGGNEPLWSHDGHELFYRGGGKVWAVDVRTSPAFRVGSPRSLFADTFTPSPNGTTGYSVTKGNRFLFAQPVQPDPPITRIQIAVNWFTELRRAGGPRR